ncbi:PQQ-dependent sugar dehydrogenase [Algibacter sp. 2305UL17-15]|uniref:PQQ-dependent sugar dehydrogenase n=1 Tax=Algibacter sp. 2305UL17-15 TaxID=3231268 RepID=UPI0034588E67
MKTLQIFITPFLCSLFGFTQTINLTSFATGFSTPVEITHTGDSRLFVAERAGVIKILNSDGTVNATPFLDISSIVGSGGERGLLGLAFAPDYDTTGRFYVNYTDNSSTDTPNTIIARYTVSGNPDIANTSGTILLSYTQPYSNHNGGKIAFGPNDGFLYIGSGDGGSGGDPQNRAQNTTSLFGKLLRIDVSGATYAIPSTNPFSGSANGVNDPRPEIYAIGLRNPWKFSFDKTEGDLWIADVGQNAFEEINKVTDSGNPGDNYGWRCYEGSSTFNTSANCPSGGFGATIAPVAEYAHVGTGCSGSVTGGYVYRGTQYANLLGKYFFADYCKQTIGILTDDGSNNWSLAFQTPNITNNWTTFGEDSSGELYIAGGSTVYKIADANLSVDDRTTSNFKIYPNPAKVSVSIDLSNNFDDVKSISILNIQGQKIKTNTFISKQIINFKTENYKSGIYFIEIQRSNQSKIVKKLIVN